MRLALANVLALAAFVGAIWVCFAFILSFAINSNAPLGFTAKLNSESFGFGLIYMMFIGPGALLGMLVCFFAFRARPSAIAALTIASGLLGIVFMTPVLGLMLGSFPGVDLRNWIMIVWAGVTATLVHHLVFSFIRPRGA